MNQNTWATEDEASKEFGVSVQTLQFWREVGYLKPGTHWRSSPAQQKSPWNPRVIYHLRWCNEVIEYWREQDVPISDVAA